MTATTLRGYDNAADGSAGGGLVVTMAVEGGGETVVSVPRLAVDVPLRRAGVVYRDRDPDWARALGATGDGVLFTPMAWSDRWRVAREMARSPVVASAVICPPGAWPVQVALALAVSETLGAGRDNRRAVVTSTARPLPRQDQLAIPHEVAVTSGDRVQVRVVWEIAGWWQGPEWLAGLSARPVAGERAGSAPGATTSVKR
ncbi:hypothetical protein I6A60_25230 [Frankia sp. AgB1.9]|uniref:hypothetical protein n=1 Tax=unclassified Frankia TaxID=2632575 RepID=UPI001931312B|nr:MULTISPECIES: hypothetical protein [unclassified Frankia]MBL7491628.1 hypothetical protein [Frankia sp. AgW1.1]MBL7551142.1 hypothetical protein [Frankia sp. AgB1.9]MBL7621871.1 hypothetical protein [Frankia sp. AgB1.8]